MNSSNFRLLVIAVEIVDICSKSLNISFNHEEVFGVRGADIFDGAPVVTDQVKFSELQWQDEDGKRGTFNFTNPKWAEPQVNTSPKQVLFYDSQDFYNRHHSDEWYETDDLLYEDEPYTWFDENVELKDAKSVSDKDYYDFLMQLYAEQQQEKNAANVPIIVKGFDTRKKKSVDIATKSPESDVNEPEPCTVKSIRLCNIFFTIPLITVIIIVLVAVYFSALFCYLQNPWNVCTNWCPRIYKYGNKYMRTKWGDAAELKFRIHVNETAQEREDLLNVRCFVTNKSIDKWHGLLDRVNILKKF